MRSMTVRAVEARPAGKSATAVLMLSGAKTLDPIFAAALGPVMMLARAVWEQWIPTSMLRSTFEWNVKVAKN
eukprot:3832433-Pyramimonas_sp.AAC.1